MKNTNQNIDSKEPKDDHNHPPYDFLWRGEEGAKNSTTTTTSANEGKQQLPPEGRRAGASRRVGPELETEEAGGAARWALSLVLKGLGPASQLDVLGLWGSGP